jgi:hypothetical protein
VVGRTKFSIKSLTASTRLFHDPRACAGATFCDSLPSRPTTRLTRSISLVLSDIISMMSLRVSAIFPSMPLAVARKRTEKSPFLTAVSTCNRAPVSSLSSLTARAIFFAIAFSFRPKNEAYTNG